MNTNPFIAQTPTGKRYDVEWFGDRAGGGSKPALPVKERITFIADVLGENEARRPLTLDELRAKYRAWLPKDRAFFKWLKWARERVPVAQ